MLESLKIENFRCIESAALSFHPQCTVIEGANGAGKTSLLEAIYALSRGRSFRSPRRDHAIKHGAGSFVLFGEVRANDQSHRVGLEISRGHRRIRIDGENVEKLSELLRFLPVHIIDPNVHELIDGGPDNRRRFLDFGLFHVEPRFLSVWSQYKRALSQRNGALREGRSDAELDAWDNGVVEGAVALAGVRQSHCIAVAAALEAIRPELLNDAGVELSFRRGWPDDADLAQRLRDNRARDREYGTTQDGAHRADIGISFRDRAARHQVSRGQQKLLAAALLLAQIDVIQRETGRRTVVMLDDPAAELDNESLERLLSVVFRLPCQRVLTGLDAARLPVPGEHSLFHVEQGRFTPADSPV